MEEIMNRLVYLSIGVLAIATCAFFAGCSPANSYDQEYEAQTKRFWEQAEASDRILAKDEEQRKRFDALLTRWEKQADRQDLILSRQEAVLDVQGSSTATK